MNERKKKNRERTRTRNEERCNCHVPDPVLCLEYVVIVASTRFSPLRIFPLLYSICLLFQVFSLSRMPSWQNHIPDGSSRIFSL